MAFSPLSPDATRWLQQAPDSIRARADSAAYDSVWTTSGATPQGLERFMVADGKIYVVVAVLLLIWFGLLVYLFRTDRKLDRLEREVDADGISGDDTSL
jgi:CcmD family protein